MYPYIEISKSYPPVITWEEDGWKKREHISVSSLKRHGFKHYLSLRVLLLLVDICS